MSAKNSNYEALRVLNGFLANPDKRYLLGATPYAAGIIGAVSVCAVIDDATKQTSFHGVPIVRTHEVPRDALVVATTLGRPHSAKEHLNNSGLAHCDYFTFHRYSGVNLPIARFWSGAAEDVASHEPELSWVRSLMVDDLSIDTFDRIISFRRSADLSEIETFKENQINQYFEDFLKLDLDQETFLDVGCFDGRTTTDFIHRCPNFKAVHIFEPDPNNFIAVKNRFAQHERIHFHRFGLSNRNIVTSFDSSGSTSTVSTKGNLKVELRALDNVNIDDITFLKMDIEGSEVAALLGARESIRQHFPRLAVSVYHRPSDLWRIPLTLMTIRSDYEVRLRHYTEGVTETVMFFLPRKK